MIAGNNLEELESKLAFLDKYYSIGNAMKTYNDIKDDLLFCNNYDNKHIKQYKEVLESIFVKHDEFTTYANLRSRIRRLFLDIDALTYN